MSSRLLKTNQSLVNRTKLYADAMKGSISRMPVEVVHFYRAACNADAV